MYFVRSGVIYLPLSSLRDAGYYNLSWASANDPTNSSFASNLYFANANLNPSNSSYNYLGFSLCVTKNHDPESQNAPHFYYSLLYFVRSGYISVSLGVLSAAGSHGYAISSTLYPDPARIRIYFFYINEFVISTSENAMSYSGLPLRI